MTTVGEYRQEHSPLTLIVRSRRASNYVHLPDGGEVEPLCNPAVRNMERKWVEKDPSVLFADAEMCGDCLSIAQQETASSDRHPAHLVAEGIEIPNGPPEDWPIEKKREILEAVSAMDVDFSEYAEWMLLSLDDAEV